MRKLPHLQFSTEWSLCYLDELRRPDVHLVVITSAPVDPYTLEYHFRDVFQFGPRQTDSAEKRLTLLSPRSRDHRPLDALVLSDESIMTTLGEISKASRKTSVIDFVASPPMEAIASFLGLGLEEGDYGLVSKWGSKAGGKTVLRRAGVAVPRGSVDLLTDEAAVVRSIGRLATAQRAVVKLNAGNWAAAIGLLRVDCERLRHTGDLFESADQIRMPVTEFRQELTANGAIVEEYIENVVSSPSGLGHIAADGTVSAGVTHEQILNSGQYWGCRFPADEKWRPGIIATVEQVGKKLANLGVRGTFGVDFIGLTDDELLAVEINIRKAGPTHVVKYVEAMVGAKIGQDGTLYRGGTPVHYVNGRMHDPGALGGLRANTVVDHLREEGLLYRHDTGEGLILHCLGALSECGYLELTSIAASETAAATMIETARSTIMQLRIR